MKEMPKYRFAKDVSALKIKKVEGDEITFIDPEFDPIVDPAYIEKYKPVAGGYYGTYNNDYKTYWPEHIIIECAELIND